MITVIQIRKQTQSKTIEANQRGSRQKKRKYAQQSSKRNGKQPKRIKEGGTVGAGCMRQGIRGTTINTRIKRNDVNEEIQPDTC
jgi:hypothetical protein